MNNNRREKRPSYSSRMVDRGMFAKPREKSINKVVRLLRIRKIRKIKKISNIGGNMREERPRKGGTFAAKSVWKLRFGCKCCEVVCAVGQQA